ncbi:hypothetical protein CC85DRAFT_291222 [Cutaneotrichosporon oleaginosum]|uniref:Mid2 domain-containing protein n=1 Tax=Cutaneotrichosporon oleaginosum TaxID=879819 RepID=A0A0J0XSH0_9TREE|nr:uncharacterized protein CC85DRAFT_291222 [Cutaneotrichosporon oleaginosum]KLT44026.1 hypothetical protein CC85DRAFT_291222 [Cutaneotrichosporon oleaginosum]TXT04028.1 hypothetical protein COLE_07725 [Cutaneotrichosporon oleaginosum]
MIPLAWLVGALALAHAAMAVSTPFYLDSFTPQLEYKPDSTNTTGQGPSWNASFTGITWAQREDKRGGKIGVGDGYHWVRGVADGGPSVSITFYGTGAEFFGFWGYLDTGSVSDGEGGVGTGAVRMSLSGGPDSLQDIATSGTSSGVGRPVSLGKYADLSRGTYTVTMRPTDGIVSFTHLVVQTDVGGSASDLTQAIANPSIYKPYIVNGDNSLGLNPKFGQFLGPPGGGALESPSGSWAGQSSDDNKRVGSRVAQESVKINLGVGNSFLGVNGTVNTNHGMFRVDIEPAPTGRQGTQDFWASTSWQVLDTILFATGLDPDTEYSLTLTNIQGQNGQPDDYNVWFDITSLTLWKVPTNVKAKAPNIIGEDPQQKKSSSSVPIGAIVGGVVGGVAVIAALALAAWFLFLRKKRTDDLFESTAYLEPETYTTTPYIVPSSPSAATFSENQPMIYHGQPISPIRARHQSPSESSDGYPLSLTDGSGRGTVGLAGLGFLGPTQQPGHWVATDAGPFHGTTPAGEMPPTYNPAWEPTDESDSNAASRTGGRMTKGR